MPDTTAPPTTPPAAHPTRLDRLPADLATERLFFAEPARTGLYLADGTMLTDAPGLGGIGYPLEPLVSGQGLVVYIHGDDAYRTSGLGSTRAVDLGPATWIFPAQHGAIGVESGGQGTGTPPFVEYMAADGAMPAPGTSRVRLSPGLTAVAQVPSGLVVAAGATLEELLNQVTHVWLSIIEVHAIVPLGPATALIGAYGATAAWVTCPSRRSSSCALHLVNTTTHHVRIIRPPPGYSGFAPGGGFSPDGAFLATFVPSKHSQGATSLHLVIVRVDSGSTSVVGAPLLAGAESVGDATWSADGHWLYFGSLSGALQAEQITAAGPHGQPWTLPLATSFAVTGD